jgi:hypothetical protein
MALSFGRATDVQLRHLVARSRGRRTLFADAAARVAQARRLAEISTRLRLHCLVWCVTDRCLHAVLRGPASANTLATEEITGSRLRYGLCQSTIVNPDLYLLEVARHVLLAPVRGGLVRRVIDWPHSSARETYGLNPAPPWLDPTPLYDLLGPRDGQGSLRFRRYIEDKTAVSY